YISGEMTLTCIFSTGKVDRKGDKGFEMRGEGCPHTRGISGHQASGGRSCTLLFRGGPCDQDLSG
ncbi:MAG: hypothetical protein KO173_04785, partial [Methanoregulaceae archaeon]|nr:hypothetical protein [Methanoregulaceae archaeon]